jgi:hypothetical protein
MCWLWWVGGITWVSPVMLQHLSTWYACKMHANMCLQKHVNTNACTPTCELGGRKLRVGVRSTSKICSGVVRVRYLLGCVHASVFECVLASCWLCSLGSQASKGRIGYNITVVRPCVSCLAPCCVCTTDEDLHQDMGHRWPYYVG